MPDHTKTGARDGPMQVDISCDAFCVASRLNELLAAHEAAACPITNWITRVQARSKVGFANKGMSSAEIANRVKKHFKAAGIFSNHTVHGSRRGSMQHDVYVLGKSSEEAGRAAQIRTPSIVQRYLDPHRHY